MVETVKEAPTPPDVVLITGSSGMVGHCIQQLVESLKETQSSADPDQALQLLNERQDRDSLMSFLQSKAGRVNFYFSKRSVDGDLADASQAESLFERVRPTFVIHLAAKVGGLFANMNDKVGFFEQNLAMNGNMIRLSHKYAVRKLVCILSTCIYPDETSYPIRAGCLHSGPPHSSNEGYAYAKRMCEVQCRLYNEQYGTNFACVVPTNLYGPNDCYSEDSSHVVAALIRRASELSPGDTLTVWGSGKPLRQFCYTPDLAILLLWVVFDPRRLESPLPLFSEKEYSIAELAQHIAANFDDLSVDFDSSKADGQHRKCTSTAELRAKLANFSFTGLEEGIELTVRDYMMNRHKYRHGAAKL